MKNFNLFNRSNAQKNTSCASVNVSNASPRDDREITERLPRRYQWAKLAATLTLLLTLSVGQMWAGPTFSGGYAYFYNKGGWSDSNKQLCIGKSSYTETRSMTAITNTKLWYNALPTSGWGDATYMAVIGNSSSWGSGSWGTSNLSNANHRTGTVNLGNWGFSSGNVNMLTPANGNNDATLTLSYIGNAYSSLNLSQTFKVQVSTDGGSTYSNPSTSPLTISFTSKTFSSYTACGTASSGSVTGSTVSNSKNAGYTATTKVEYSSLNSDYEFVCWHDGSGSVGTGTSYTYYPTAATTITARVKLKQFTVSYGVCSTTRNGSIKLNSGSAVTTTGSSTLNINTSLSFTATPNTGYQVEGWYSDAACSAGNRLQSGGTSYDAGTLTAATTVYVKFEARTGGVITLNAGTGGQVSKDNSTWGSSATITGVTTSADKNIYARANTGYTFNTWTKSSGSGTIKTNAASGKFTTVAYEDATLTASFNETMRTITIVNGVVYGGSATSTTAGVTTTAKITANTPAAGKKFTGWTLGSGASLKSGYNSTDRTIEINATADATVTANYADRAGVTLYFAKPSGWSTVYAYAWNDGGTTNATWPGANITSNTVTTNYVTYYILQYYTEADGIGGAATGESAWNKVIFSDNGSNQTADLTLSDGHYYFKSSTGTGKAAALTSAWCIKGDWNSWSEDADQITHTAAATGSKIISFSTAAQEFKIYNIVNETWWRINGNVSAKLSATAMNNGDGNMTLTPTIAGNYTFTLSTLTGTPKLAITYPEAYQLTYSIGSVAGTDGSISSSPTTASGSYVPGGNTVTLTAPNAKTGYTWKGWYGAAAGTGDQLCATQAYAVTMDAKKTLYACYTENTFTVSASASPAAGGTIVKPASATSMGQVTGGAINATANAGYQFAGWSIASGSGYFGDSGTSTTSNTPNTKFRPTAATTLTATFSEIMRTVSVKANNNAFGSVSSTSLTNVGPATQSAAVTATPAAGATFVNWTIPAGVTLAAGYSDTDPTIKVNATAASKTITANFSETMHTATISTANASHGTVSPSSASVGQITAVQITATAQTGYMFSGWVKTAGTGTVTYHTGAGTGKAIAATGDKQATTYITIDGNVTLQATWEEDRSSGWYMRGNWTNGWANSGQKAFVKDVGESTGTVSHVRWTLEPSNFSNSVMEMKMWDGSKTYGHWNGIDAPQNNCTKDGNNTNITFYQDADGDPHSNFRISIPVYGEYDFEWDSSTKQLTVHYPAGNFIRGEFNSWDWSAPMTGTGPYTATISLPADALYATASSGSTGFKYVVNGDHYGKNGTISASSRSLSSCTTDGQNMGLATTMAGNYTFQVNAAKTQVTVTYPTIPAMTGTVGLTVTGYRSGSGTSALPYNVFAGDVLTLSPSHTNAPSADDHFKYTYYKGAKNASTATTEITTRLSTADNKTCAYDVGSTTGKYPLKVGAYYEYGPDGYKAKGTAQTSSIVYYEVWLAPSVALTADVVSIKEGVNGSFTLTATPSNVGLASALAKVSYEFFNGNSTDPANKIGETIQKSNGDAVTKTITPTYNTTTDSWTYTVKMTFLGFEKTATITIYRKWDIYVDDVCSWGALKLYMWDGGGSYPVAFPGTAMPLVTGSTHWYVVTLDTRYQNFKLSKQKDTESGNHTASISTYPEGTYWYLNNCQTLTQLTLTNPTVVITSATIINTHQIKLQGNVTNFGGDGSTSEGLTEVGFYVGATKYTAGCTSNSNGTFTKVVTGLTAGTEYTVKAFATNMHGTGESATQSITTRANGTTRIHVRSAVGRATPKVHAWTGAQDCGGVREENAASLAAGVAMTLDITGTVYKWYHYDISNDYNSFQITDNDVSVASMGQNNPFEETCYWYHPTESTQGNRLGTMDCPYTTPQLMIDDGTGGNFTYHEMSTSPTISVDLILAVNTTYQFKPVYNAEWYGKASTTLTRASNSASSLSASVEDNLRITTDVPGTYRFTFTAPNTITVTYPTAYTVTFGLGTGGATITASAASAGGSMSSGAYVAEGDDITFTQTASTGYTFKGWYTTADGSTTVPTMSASDNVLNSIAANATVYAQYTPKTYTVSFNKNGGSGTTPSPITVTYNAPYGTLPAGPTPPGGDSFVGWFTTASGAGVHVTEETIVTTASNHTLYARYENTFDVTIRYKCGDITLRANTTTKASPTAIAAAINAPDILGYAFSGWTGNPAEATFGNASSASTTVNATAATTITANYTAVPMVYFKNNLDWDSVFVSFNITWTTVDGKQIPVNKNKPYYKMTQLGSSDIYYCEIPAAYVSSWKKNIAFDNTGYGYDAVNHVGTWDKFYGGKFTGRSDFDPNLTMYIPYNGNTEARNGGTYYKTGCWMKYNSTESGYTIYANTYVTGSGGTAVAGTPVALEAEVAGSFEFKAKVYLPNGSTTYGFMLHKEYQSVTDAIWYTNYGTIERSNLSSLPWDFTDSGASENGTRCGIRTEAKGDYEFTVSFGTGRPMVSVEYPVSVGDYRLVYKDRATWSDTKHSTAWNHPSRIIKAAANAKDTISFFVSYGSTPTVELQKCTAISNTGIVTWTKQGDNVSLSSIKKAGVYNFHVGQNASKVATKDSVRVIGAYTGNYYIRTDASDGGWSNYYKGANNLTYSEYSLDHGGSAGPYSHYFMRHVNAGQNIKFVIANDYSMCISDTVDNDTYVSEWIEVEANVRFMWNHNTNKINRAYISGSSLISDRFLVLEGDAHLYDANGNALAISGLNPNEINFIDDQNWIYETEVQADPNERIKLTAKFNGKVQYFYGAEGARSIETTYQLIEGTGSNKYKMRVVYDFKTNRLVCAWLPNGDITAETSLEADVMIIRYHQEDAQNVTFSGKGKLTDVKTVYGAMKFNKYRLNNQNESYPHGGLGLSPYARDLFFISFPFEVKLHEVFGFGTYGKHWIIEYYDGKTRAEKGYWKDSPTNWKFVTKAMKDTFVLKANEGYVLALDLDELTFTSPIWTYGVENVYLYFPSTATVENIQATTKTVSIDTVGYQCKINRNTPNGDRRVKDSHWHLIGVPSYANASHSTSTSWNSSYDGDLEQTIYYPNVNPADWASAAPYVYDWNAQLNRFGVISTSSYSFKPMHSYLIQYARDSLIWRQVNTTVPASVAARRNADFKSIYEFRLELQSNGEEADHTFISLRDDEEVTSGFDFNYDLSKELYGAFTPASQIYTIIDEDVQAAGNCLPLETEQVTTVPVGVVVKSNGEYTFAMPDGADGLSVTLLDSETGVHTDLSIDHYTIELEAGTYEGRFFISIDPRNAATLIDCVSGEGEELRTAKVFRNGILYIQRGNTIYDATGKKVE